VIKLITKYNYEYVALVACSAISDKLPRMTEVYHDELEYNHSVVSLIARIMRRNNILRQAKYKFIQILLLSIKYFVVFGP
jgi:hypothetical protein